MKKLLLHDEASLVFQPHPSLLLVWAVTNKKQTNKITIVAVKKQHLSKFKNIIFYKRENQTQLAQQENIWPSLN